MRRRVSREQLLDASQSILSPRGNLRCKGDGSFCSTVAYGAKGKPAKIPVPGSGTDSPSGCEPQVDRALPDLPGSSRQRDRTRRRRRGPREEFSFLQKRPRPWNPLGGREGFGFLRGASPTRGGVRGTP